LPLYNWKCIFKASVMIFLESQIHSTAIWLQCLVKTHVTTGLQVVHSCLFQTECMSLSKRTLTQNVDFMNCELSQFGDLSDGATVQLAKQHTVLCTLFQTWHENYRLTYHLYTFLRWYINVFYYTMTNN
jgi:hypothetical protein